MRLRRADDVPTARQRDERKVWYALVQVYKEFASESTVHGIKYTTQAKTTVERFLWLVVVIISLASAGQLANKFYERHESANTRTTVVTNQYPSLKIAVPAVTLCQGNLVSAERLRHLLDTPNRLFIPPGLNVADFAEGVQYLRKIVYPSNLFAAELEKLQRILDANRLSLSQLLTQLSPNCTDLLLTCVYNGQIVDCTELFVPTLTNYGICCSFNYAFDERDMSGEHHLYTTEFGSRYLLSVLLKPYNASDRIASTTFGDGYRVLVHEKYTIPGPNAVEFMVGAGYETIVGLQGTYLTSSSEVLDLPRAQRDCKASRKGQTYRSESCYMTCRAKAIRARCDCLPFYSLQQPLTRDDDDIVQCNLMHIPCLSQIISETYSLSLRDSQCDCLPDCEITKYAAAITGDPFDAAPFKAGTFYEKAQIYQNSTALHITFGRQAAILERRELVLSWINLVSSLGGVFSLFLGCSFISIIEIFYFFFFQLIRKLKLQYEKSSTVINS